MANENVQAPSPLVHLQWFADDLVEIEGQGEPAPVDDGQGKSPAATAAKAAPSKAESYFFDDPDSGESFKTREDLAKAWKQSYLRREDYSRKTADVAAQRKQHETERAAFEKLRKDFDEEMRQRRGEFEKYDKFIRGNPRVYQLLQKEMQSGSGQQGFDKESMDKYFEEKYGADIQAIRNQRQKEAADTLAKEAFAEMKLMYDDFDEGPIQAAYDKLLQDNNIKSLMEVLYYAEKGRSINKLDVERDITRKLEKKKEGGLTPPQGSKPSGGTKVHRNLNEAAAMAKKNWDG